MEFADLSKVDLSVLRWTRVAGERHSFHLGAGDATVAELAWQKSHGSLATASTKDGQWTLKRAGLLHAHLTMRSAGSEKDLARVFMQWRDHLIQLAGGATYHLRRDSLLVPAWTVSDAASSQPAFVIEPVREGRRLEGGIVTVRPEARALPALGLLLLLSWYFVVLSWFEDETASEWADHVEGRF